MHSSTACIRPGERGRYRRFAPAGHRFALSTHGAAETDTLESQFFAELFRVNPRSLFNMLIVKPETVVRWHRTGFRLFLRMKCRSPVGRPKVPLEIRSLIREMSHDNPLWGVPRIHGELLKLGIEISQSTVAKYMVKRRGPPLQSWRTFLCNHADGIAAIDLFVVRHLVSSCCLVWLSWVTAGDRFCISTQHTTRRPNGSLAK